jgi:hypothetical protein
MPRAQSRVPGSDNAGTFGAMEGEEESLTGWKWLGGSEKGEEGECKGIRKGEGSINLIGGRHRTDTK